MTNKVIALVAVCLCLAAAAVFWYFTRPTEPTCINPPEVMDQATRKALLDAALKLEKIPLDATLKTQFEEISKTTFKELSDKEAAFLMLLRAIDCYMTRADTPEKTKMVGAIVPELITAVKAMWASSHDLKGDGKGLSAKEREILGKSPFGTQLIQELEKHGVR